MSEKPQVPQKWKLVYTGRHSLPLDPPDDPGALIREFDSLDAALREACDMLKGTHHRVIRIKQPSGPDIELEAIKHWCDAQPKAP